MITRVHHVGVVVRNLDEAYRLFRDTLGLPLVVEECIEDQGVKAALLDLGNSLLELLEPVEPDTGIARYLERRGEGLHHVCLEADDIEAELAGLKAKGVELVDETPRPGLTGTIAFLHPSALHGVLVELVHGPSALRVEAEGRARWRLDHLIFAVQDLAAAARAWAETLGLRAQSAFRPPKSHLELARLPLDQPEGAFLELVTDVEWKELAPSDAEALARLPRSRRVARFLAERGEGMFSISIGVDGLDAAVEELRARGAAVSDPETGAWPGMRPRPERSRRVARIPRARAHGVAVQLIERRG